MNRPLHLTALAAAAGGAAWIVKFAVIAAAGGDPADALTSVLYVGGIVLMAVGAATLTLRLARGRVLTALAALLAPFAFFASFVVLDGIAQALAGDVSPVWLGDEVGIVLTGAVWLIIGLWAVRDSAGAAAGARTRVVPLDGAAS